MLIVYCMGNFHLIKPENQQWEHMEKRFYSRSYISQGDQVGYSSGGGTISLYPLVLTKYSWLFGLSVVSFEKHFSFLSVVV